MTTPIEALRELLRVASAPESVSHSAYWAAIDSANSALAQTVKQSLTTPIEALRCAAKALVDRWDTPAWKDVPHTGEYIAALRAALAQPELQPESRPQSGLGYKPWERGVLAELQAAAAAKWTGDPAAQRAGLFARAAAEIERLNAVRAARPEPLFGEMIAQLPGLAEELKAIAQPAAEPDAPEAAMKAKP